MAKVTGYKCDVCHNVENGVSDAPYYWSRLYLPRTSDVEQPEAKDICSNKCLLNFAKERGGHTPVKSRSGFDPNLAEFLLDKGIKRASFGPLSRGHIHHSNKGIVQDNCLICEFMSQPAGINGNV